MSESNIVLSIQKIKKAYVQGKKKISVLKGASLDLKEGDMLALLGPSGCGKSTLLQITGLLDQPDSGKIFINGNNIIGANDKLRTKYRRENIGFVYQFHHLLAEFSALENVVIPQMISGENESDAIKNAKEVLKFLGLSGRLENRPAELSGGEQQRVAIARAIVNKPSLILADEPTGNLDPKTANDVFDVLLKITKDIGIAVLMVTHNHDLAKKMDKTVYLQDGVLN